MIVPPTKRTAARAYEIRACKYPSTSGFFLIWTLYVERHTIQATMKKDKIPTKVKFGVFLDTQFDPKDREKGPVPCTVIYWYFAPNQKKPTPKQAYASGRYVMYHGHATESEAKRLLEKHALDFRATVENLMSQKPVELLPVPSDDASTPDKLKLLLQSLAAKARS